MSKKVMILRFTGLILTAMYFMSGAMLMPQDMMMEQYGRYGIRLADKNLFPAPMMLRFKDDIGLTADQVKKIEKIQDTQKELFIKKQADIDIKKIKLNAYLKEDHVDRSKMESMVREIGNMRTDLQILHISELLDLREILTPDQIKKLEDLKSDWMGSDWMGQRMWQRMGERMGQRNMGMRGRMDEQSPMEK